MRIAYPCEFAYGNRHVVTLMQLSFDFYMLEAKAEHRIGDRAYDSDGPEAGLKQNGREHDRPAPAHPETQDAKQAPTPGYQRR